jgi:hypothetical protein
MNYRLWVSHRIPRTFYPKSCRAYFGFLSTFPSLAGLNHLLDAEGNEVAQQDEQEDSWLAVLEPLQIGLAWSYISYHFLSWASLFLGIRRWLEKCCNEAWLGTHHSIGASYPSVSSFHETSTSQIGALAVQELGIACLFDWPAARPRMMRWFS